MSKKIDLMWAIYRTQVCGHCVMCFAIHTSFLTNTSRPQPKIACCTSYNNLKTFIGLLKSYGAIDGTHIPIAERLNKRYTIATTNYYN
jgi:hypothetical protein